MTTCRLCDTPTMSPSGLCRYCQHIDNETLRLNEARRQPSAWERREDFTTGLDAWEY